MPEPVASPSLDPGRIAYLAALDAALGLPSAERADVHDEIAAHLADLRSELVEGGLSPDAASEEAIRRLGAPEVLGREITRARQNRRALLASVGGATWAATGAAFRGLILGIALVTVVIVSGLLVLVVAARIAGTTTWSPEDAGWFTALSGVAFWFAAWHGGRALVSGVANRSHYRAEALRRWLAFVGGPAVGWLTLVWFNAAQDLASVVSLALVPVVFVAAVLTGSDRPLQRSRQARRASLALFATVVVALPLLVFIGAAQVTTGLSSVGSGPYASMEDLLRAQGFDMPGRFVPDPPDLGNADWSPIGHGITSVHLGNAVSVTERWHDLRLEAWQAVLSSGQLDRAHRAPFATAPMTTESGQLVGTVRVDRTRDVVEWWLVVTGIAPDGQRDLIASLGGSSSTFTGSAWDWLTAP